MKKYQTKPEVVEACQYDGTWESLEELREMNPCSITCDNHHHYLNEMLLKKGCWIVKRPDVIESLEQDAEVFEFIIMRDDQFHGMYGVLGQSCAY